MPHPFDAYDQQFAAKMQDFQRAISEMEKTLASAALSPDEFTPAVEELQRRLALRREKINTLKDRPAMKYALESLPELIGENQFRDLCVALDIDTNLQVPTGDDFAKIVRHKVIKHHDQRQAERQRQQSERLI